MSDQVSITPILSDIYIQSATSKAGNDYKSLVFEFKDGDTEQVFLDSALMKLMFALAKQAQLKDGQGGLIDNDSEQ